MNCLAASYGASKTHIYRRQRQSRSKLRGIRLIAIKTDTTEGASCFSEKMHKFWHVMKK